VTGIEHLGKISHILIPVVIFRGGLGRGLEETSEAVYEFGLRPILSYYVWRGRSAVWEIRVYMGVKKTGLNIRLRDYRRAA